MIASSPTYGSSIAVATVHENINVELIVVTADKLRIVLDSHKDCLSSRAQWQVPAGILVSILSLFATTNFKDALSLKSDYWAALFTFIAIANLVWLILSLKKLKGQGSLESLIDKIKKGA